MATQPGPAVRRRQLGRDLRRLRIEAGFKTIEAAAERAGLSRATVSRIENAKQTILPRTVRLLCQTYGVGAPLLSHLVQLAEGADERGWHLAYSDTVPDWFDRYVGEETEATDIHSYEAEYVPGLFQTADYCRAVTMAAGPGVSESDLQQSVEFRQARQARLSGETPPRLVSVLNEAVVHRKVGGDKVMRDQLTRLLELSALPHVTIRVLPYDAGAHPAMTGSFSLLRFPGDDAVTTIFVEVQQGALYPDRPTDIDRYTWVFDRLLDLALPEKKTNDLLSRLVSEL